VLSVSVPDMRRGRESVPSVTLPLVLMTFIKYIYHNDKLYEAMKMMSLSIVGLA